MKVWLLNPPYFPKFSRPQRSPAVTKSGTIYFPVWLAGATALLENSSKFDVTLTDAPAENQDLNAILELAVNLNPDFLVVDTSTPSIENDISICEAIKEKMPHVFILLVGTHVSALAHEVLLSSSAIDGVARKEYDFTVLEVAKMILMEKEEQVPMELSTIKGLSYINKNEIIHNPDRPFIKNLDSLPWVSKTYKSHLDLKNYFNPNALFPMVTLLTSRGCPFQCKFCVYPQTLTGRAFRFRSIDDVVNEMIYIEQYMPEAKSVFFEDDTLTSTKKRCVEFCKAIIESKIRLPWTTNSRIDPDYETLKLLKEAGCRSLCVGFESGDQKILDNMKKGIKVEKMFTFMENAKRAGILIHGCFMFGFPGQDKKSVKKTIQLAIELEPDTVQFYPVMVYPGTEAFQEYQEKGWISQQSYKHWLTEKGLHNCVIKNEFFSETELVKLCDDARREFYLRYSYIGKKAIQILKNPGEAKRIIKAFTIFSKHLIQGSDLSK